MNNNVRQLVLAAVAVQASISALGAFWGAVTFASGFSRHFAAWSYIALCLTVATLLHKTRGETPASELRILLVVFFTAAGIFSVFRQLFPFAAELMPTRVEHPIGTTYGVAFIISLATAALFTWLYKRSDVTPN